MNHKKILDHIEELVSEELLLFAKFELTETESKRLSDIETEMAKCWVQLHRQRIKKETAENQINITSDTINSKIIKF